MSEGFGCHGMEGNVGNLCMRHGHGYGTTNNHLKSLLGIGTYKPSPNPEGSIHSLKQLRSIGRNFYSVQFGLY